MVLSDITGLVGWPSSRRSKLPGDFDLDKGQVKFDRLGSVLKPEDGCGSIMGSSSALDLASPYRNLSQTARTRQLTFS